MTEVDFKAKATKGDKNFDRITKLTRMFLPNIYDRDNNLLCINASVSPYSITSNKAKKKKKVTKEEYFYDWGGSFSVRQGNISVFLHNGVHDQGLIHFERKLLLLKEKIDLFIEKVEGAKELAPEEDFSERTWLNPVDVEPDYTGYVYIGVKKDGNARFYMADCHRTINLFIENWVDTDDKKIENPFNELTLEFLKGISENVVVAIELIKELREQFLSAISAED